MAYFVWWIVPLQARILLAEDDEISQEIVKLLLASIGLEDLTIAADGREALLTCMARKFDLLIVDRKMPLIPGDRLVRQLRAAKNPNFETPIILFSASTYAELKEMGASCPADLILSKPIKPPEFLASVMKMIGL